MQAGRATAAVNITPEPPPERAIETFEAQVDAAGTRTVTRRSTLFDVHRAAQRLVSGETRATRVVPRVCDSPRMPVP